MPAAMNGYDPYSYINVNITGMLNVLEYSKNNNVNRIIFTQTEADLSGYWEENVVIKPDMPRNFSYKGNYSLYIISKCTAVDLIESYYQNYGLRRFIFRLPTVYHYRPDPYFYKNGVKTLLGIVN
jgi:UDP-glucose 4-epimerase